MTFQELFKKIFIWELAFNAQKIKLSKNKLVQNISLANPTKPKTENFVF